MSYEGIVLRAVTHECNLLLIGSRIDKISQPNRHEIILTLRNQNKNIKLLISTLPQEGRIHLTTTTPPNPSSPPLFCMVLRKHLEGGRILSFEQIGLDRILVITVQCINEMGDKVNRQLIAEIMGKHSNLILVDPQVNKIIDSIHRVPASISRYRQVLPGYEYNQPPTKGKLPLWDEQPEQFAARLLAAGLNKPIDKLLLSIYDGLGPQTVQEILHRANINPSQTIEFFGDYDYQRLFQIIKSLGNQLLNHQYQPEVILVNNKTKAFSAISLTQSTDALHKPYKNVNEMLDFYFQNRGVVNLFKQKQSDLEQIIHKEQERCEKKAGLQALAIQDAKDAQIWRLYGELLMANHYKLEAGPQAVVTNFYEDNSPEVVVPMDPTINPMQNAQAYFKRYQKAQHTAGQAQKYYDETLIELTYLESLLASLSTVTELSELEEIKVELQEAGYLKSQQKNKKYGSKSKDKYSRKGQKLGVKNNKKGNQLLQTGQVLINDFQVLYGKNNRQNDQVTMKQARSDDLWLHTQKIPSAHVIIRNPERRNIPNEVIEKAAKLCVWNSKARLSSQVPVDYTQRQNVWKPKGAKPGMVLYKNYQTLFVSVDEDEILKLKEQ